MKLMSEDKIIALYLETVRKIINTLWNDKDINHKMARSDKIAQKEVLEKILGMRKE
tara:strand:+ start:372 stop:539 length:168 start_codon:yes stop_codon:yes gene_type:complete